jgi:deoxyribodipyrimidine photo-lyase
MLPASLVWFRRDLRNTDHAALHHALLHSQRVYCAFVFDRAILDPLSQREDRRVEFILASLAELDQALRSQGGGLIVRHGWAEQEIPQLAQSLGIAAVFTNHDYEPDAIARDERVTQSLSHAGIRFASFKDQVIFERDEILTQSGTPFSVFTPYKNAWLRRVSEADLASLDCQPAAGQLAPPPAGTALPRLADIGFAPSNLASLALPTGMLGGQGLFEDFLARMPNYRSTRDFPAIRGVSYLSTHLRFGTVSIRELARAAWQRRGEAGADTWLAELIWREFYMQILWHRPDVVTHAFRPEYEQVHWEEGPEADARFAAWCAGQTGYPLVDRLRMVAASFLTKDLGIHWLRGERFFAAHLNDFDLAANNGGWQWAASTGCDAQPWFRIFNPVTQSQKFDPDGQFIRRYLPELKGTPDKHLHAPWLMSHAEQASSGCLLGKAYPMPIVDHAAARAKTLVRFEVVKTRPPAGQDD